MLPLFDGLTSARFVGKERMGGRCVPRVIVTGPFDGVNGFGTTTLLGDDAFDQVICTSSISPERSGVRMRRRSESRIALMMRLEKSDVKGRMMLGEERREIERCIVRMRGHFADGEGAKKRRFEFGGVG